jgi:hypothetical protein
MQAKPQGGPVWWQRLRLWWLRRRLADTNYILACIEHDKVAYLNLREDLKGKISTAEVDLWISSN